MTKTIFKRKDITESVSSLQARTTSLEIAAKAADVVPGTTTQDLHFQWQATSYSGAGDNGDARVYANTAPTTIDEETNVAVAAYATFDDIGGNAAGSADVFDATLVKVPLLEGEAKTAYYRGHGLYLNEWNSSLHPEVSHSKKFMAGHSFGMNIPGTVANDQKTFVYYDTNAGFNISASISACIWFYPTDTSQIASETFRYLIYRWIDASNYFQVLIKPSDQKVYVFTDEAAAVVKLVSNGTVNLNAWNLIIFSYNPTTNALVMYLNNDATSSTPGDTPTTPYTTNSNMYLGGLPGLPDKRYTGYIDSFVFWTGKILTGTEATNMWNHGTII